MPNSEFSSYVQHGETDNKAKFEKVMVRRHKAIVRLLCAGLENKRLRFTEEVAMSKNHFNNILKAWPEMGLFTTYGECDTNDFDTCDLFVLMHGKYLSRIWVDVLEALENELK